MLIRPYFAELFGWLEEEIAISVGCKITRFQMWLYDNDTFPISFTASMLFYPSTRENIKSKKLKLTHSLFKFDMFVLITRFNKDGMYVSYFTIIVNDTSVEKLYVLDKLAYDNIQLSFAKYESIDLVNG